MRLGKASGRAADDGSGATEPRRREDGVMPSAPASEARSERQRAECARDRDRNGEDREAGFVEPGGAKPRPAE